MNECLSRGKELLKMLINNGYEAYFIGDAVRDTILEKPIRKIEITTSASVESIKKVFHNFDYEMIDEKNVKIIYTLFEFIIHPFEIVDNSNPNTLNSTNKHYSKNLLDNLAIRDFTINAIAMSHSGKLTDAYDGYTDVMKKRINVIGSPKVRFTKEPHLIIRAFALMSELNFRLISKTKKGIKKKRKNLDNVPLTAYAKDLKKVFEGPYARKAITMINKTNVENNIPSLKKVFHRLGMHYKKITFEEALLMAFVSEGKIDDRYREVIDNYTRFVSIFTLACANKKAIYDSMTLFGHGVDICVEANRINYLLGKCSKKDKKIKKKWDKLPIKKYCDLAYKGEDIMKIIDESDYPRINDVLDEVVLAILNKQITNNRSDIEKLVITVLKQNSISYGFEGLKKVEDYQSISDTFNNYNAPVVPEVQREPDPFINEVTNHRLDMLEQKLEEQSRIIKEKELQIREMEDQKIKKATDMIVNKSMEFINTNDDVRNMIKDINKFKEELNDFIFDYLEDEGDYE